MTDEELIERMMAAVEEKQVETVIALVKEMNPKPLDAAANLAYSLALLLVWISNTQGELQHFLEATLSMTVREAMRIQSKKLQADTPTEGTA